MKQKGIPVIHGGEDVNKGGACSFKCSITSKPGMVAWY